MFTITPVYAALAALFYVFLSSRVVRLRMRERVALGDGGNRLLQRAVRVHGNFAEYAVFGLLLMTLAEAQEAAGWQVHLVGGLLIAGRLLHAWSLAGEPLLWARIAGITITFAALVVAAAVNLIAAL